MLGTHNLLWSRWPKIVLRYTLLAFFFYQLLVRRVTASSSHTLLKMGSILALVRLGVLCFLLVFYWTEKMQYWHVLLLIFFLPEGFFCFHGM